MEVRTLKNGTKQGKDGKFLPGVLPATAFDSSRGRDAAVQRHAKEAAVRERLKTKGVISRGDTYDDVMADGWADVYDGARAISHKAPDRAAKTLATIEQAAGTWGGAEREGNRSMVAVQVIVSSAADAQVSRIAAAAGDVLDGELEA